MFPVMYGMVPTRLLFLFLLFDNLSRSLWIDVIAAAVEEVIPNKKNSFNCLMVVTTSPAAYTL